MKLTRARLQQIIKEELKALNENWGEGDHRSLDDAKVGDYVELSVDDTGYETNIELIDPKAFKPALSPYGGEAIKLLAKIVQVGGDEPSDEPSGEPSESDPESEEELVDVGGGQLAPASREMHYRGQG